MIWRWPSTPMPPIVKTGPDIWLWPQRPACWDSCSDDVGPLQVPWLIFWVNTTNLGFGLNAAVIHQHICRCEWSFVCVYFTQKLWNRNHFSKNVSGLSLKDQVILGQKGEFWVVSRDLFFSILPKTGQSVFYFDLFNKGNILRIFCIF